MEPVERSIGTRVAFLLPSLKLKGQYDPNSTFEQEIHRFLMTTFNGYTTAAGNLFGYWRDERGSDSYGEHRQFTVALADEARLPGLKRYLSELAAKLQEECVYLETGARVSLIYH